MNPKDSEQIRVFNRYLHDLGINVTVHHTPTYVERIQRWLESRRSSRRTESGEADHSDDTAA